VGVLVVIGLVPALMMLGFFVVQGLVVVLERVLRVPKWPRPAGHAWVVATMLASSPLFVLPLLQCLGL